MPDGGRSAVIDRDALALLQAVGAAVRAPAAQPDARRAAAACETLAAVEELRETLRTGMDAGMREELAAHDRRAARLGGRKSGWRQQPQCGGCKRLLKAPGVQCPSCGFFDGGGYLPVAPKTSYLERWH